MFFCRLGSVHFSHLKCSKCVPAGGPCNLNNNKYVPQACKVFQEEGKCHVQGACVRCLPEVYLVSSHNQLSQEVPDSVWAWGNHLRCEEALEECTLKGNPLNLDRMRVISHKDILELLQCSLKIQYNKPFIYQ